MSMFTIAGEVAGTFTQPARTDDKTGEVQEAKDKVQIYGEMPTPSGETRRELVTLTCEDRRVYEPFKGRQVRIPMGVFSPAKNQVIYYIPKGSQPEVVGGVEVGPGAAVAGLRAGQ